MTNRFEITVQEAAEELKKSQPPRLLDVRQPYEWDLVRMEGAELVSQELVEEMLDSWPKDTAIICYCHHGHRSLNAVAYLSGQGFTNVKSLRGGINAWAIEVDPSMSRY